MASGQTKARHRQPLPEDQSEGAAGLSTVQLSMTSKLASPKTLRISQNGNYRFAIIATAVDTANR